MDIQKENENNSELDDIYNDFADFDLGKTVDELKTENQDLVKHVESQERNIKKLADALVQMQIVNKSLTTNISSLYKTAKAEIDRKQGIIEDLRTQLQNGVFRRRPMNQRNRYREQTPTREFKLEVPAVKVEIQYDEMYVHNNIEHNFDSSNHQLFDNDNKSNLKEAPEPCTYQKLPISKPNIFQKRAAARQEKEQIDIVNYSFACDNKDMQCIDRVNNCNKESSEINYNKIEQNKSENHVIEEFKENTLTIHEQVCGNEITEGVKENTLTTNEQEFGKLRKGYRIPLKRDKSNTRSMDSDNTIEKTNEEVPQKSDDINGTPDRFKSRERSNKEINTYRRNKGNTRNNSSDNRIGRTNDEGSEKPRNDITTDRFQSREKSNEEINDRHKEHKGNTRKIDAALSLERVNEEIKEKSRNCATDRFKTREKNNEEINDNYRGHRSRDGFERRNGDIRRNYSRDRSNGRFGRRNSESENKYSRNGSDTRLERRNNGRIEGYSRNKSSDRYDRRNEGRDRDSYSINRTNNGIPRRRCSEYVDNYSRRHESRRDDYSSPSDRGRNRNEDSLPKTRPNEKLDEKLQILNNEIKKKLRVVEKMEKGLTNRSYTPEELIPEITHEDSEKQPVEVPTRSIPAKIFFTANLANILESIQSDLDTINDSAQQQKRGSFNTELILSEEEFSILEGKSPTNTKNKYTEIKENVKNSRRKCISESYDDWEHRIEANNVEDNFLDSKKHKHKSKKKKKEQEDRGLKLTINNDTNFDSSEHRDETLMCMDDVFLELGLEENISITNEKEDLKIHKKRKKRKKKDSDTSPSSIEKRKSKKKRTSNDVPCEALFDDKKMKKMLDESSDADEDKISIELEKMKNLQLYLEASSPTISKNCNKESEDTGNTIIDTKKTILKGIDDKEKNKMTYLFGISPVIEKHKYRKEMRKTVVPISDDFTVTEHKKLNSKCLTIESDFEENSDKPNSSLEEGEIVSSRKKVKKKRKSKEMTKTNSHTKEKSKKKLVLDEPQGNNDSDFEENVTKKNNKSPTEEVILKKGSVEKRDKLYLTDEEKNTKTKKKRRLQESNNNLAGNFTSNEEIGESSTNNLIHYINKQDATIEKEGGSKSKVKKKEKSERANEKDFTNDILLKENSKNKQELKQPEITVDNIIENIINKNSSSTSVKKATQAEKDVEKHEEIELSEKRLPFKTISASDESLSSNEATKTKKKRKSNETHNSSTGKFAESTSSVVKDKNNSSSTCFASNEEKGKISTHNLAQNVDKQDYCKEEGAQTALEIKSKVKKMEKSKKTNETNFINDTHLKENSKNFKKSEKTEDNSVVYATNKNTSSSPIDEVVPQKPLNHSKKDPEEKHEKKKRRSKEPANGLTKDLVNNQTSKAKQAPVSNTLSLTQPGEALDQTEDKIPTSSALKDSSSNTTKTPIKTKRKSRERANSSYGECIQNTTFILSTKKNDLTDYKEASLQDIHDKENDLIISLFGASPICAKKITESKNKTLVEDICFTSNGQVETPTPSSVEQDLKEKRTRPDLFAETEDTICQTKLSDQIPSAEQRTSNGFPVPDDPINETTRSKDGSSKMDNLVETVHSHHSTATYLKGNNEGNLIENSDKDHLMKHNSHKENAENKIVIVSNVLLQSGKTESRLKDEPPKSEELINGEVTDQDTVTNHRSQEIVNIEFEKPVPTEKSNNHEKTAAKKSSKSTSRKDILLERYASEENQNQLKLSKSNTEVSSAENNPLASVISKKVSFKDGEETDNSRKRRLEKNEDKPKEISNVNPLKKRKLDLKAMQEEYNNIETILEKMHQAEPECIPHNLDKKEEVPLKEKSETQKTKINEDILPDLPKAETHPKTDEKKMRGITKSSCEPLRRSCRQRRQRTPDIVANSTTVKKKEKQGNKEEPLIDKNQVTQDSSKVMENALNLPNTVDLQVENEKTLQETNIDSKLFKTEAKDSSKPGQTITIVSTNNTKADDNITTVPMEKTKTKIIENSKNHKTVKKLLPKIIESPLKPPGFHQLPPSVETPSKKPKASRDLQNDGSSLIKQSTIVNQLQGPIAGTSPQDPNISPISGQLSKTRKRITPTRVKDPPVCSFENILEKNSQMKLFSKNFIMESNLNLTEEGEIPILHIEENHFINMEDGTQKTFDKSIMKLLDCMNVSNLDSSLNKLNDNVNMSSENLTFENVMEKVKSTSSTVINNVSSKIDASEIDNMTTTPVKEENQLKMSTSTPVRTETVSSCQRFETCDNNLNAKVAVQKAVADNDVLSGRNDKIVVKPTGTLNSIVVTVNSNVAPVDSDVAAVNPAIAVVKPGVATVNLDIAPVNSDVAAVSPAIAAVKPDVTTVNFDVATVKSDVATASSMGRRVTSTGECATTAGGPVKSVGGSARYRRRCYMVKITKV